ncbi:hypothetical protein Hanom_Chr10g00963521 [Helianthus anomalus]
MLQTRRLRTSHFWSLGMTFSMPSSQKGHSLQIKKKKEPHFSYNFSTSRINLVYLQDKPLINKSSSTPFDLSSSDFSMKLGTCFILCQNNIHIKIYTLC